MVRRHAKLRLKRFHLQNEFARTGVTNDLERCIAVVASECTCDVAIDIFGAAQVDDRSANIDDRGSGRFEQRC